MRAFFAFSGRPVAVSALLTLLYAPLPAAAQDLPTDCAPGAVGCTSTTLSWFHRDGLFDDLDFDTGWLPGSSPLQLRLRFQLGGGSEVEMRGDALTSWPAALSETVVGVPGGGRLSVNYGLELGVFFRIDVVVGGVPYMVEREIPIPGIPSDLRVAHEQTFDPLLLPPAEPAEASDATERVQILDLDALGMVIPIPGISGGLRVDADAQLTASYRTTRVVVDRATRAMEAAGDSVIVGPVPGEDGFGAFQDIAIHPEGTLGYQGLLRFYPTIYVEIAGAGFTYEIAEIPIRIVNQTSDVVFDDAIAHVPLPDIAVDETMVELPVVELGRTHEELIRIRNEGEAPLFVQPRMLGEPFALGASSLTIPPSSTGSLAIQFAPTTEDATVGVLFLDSNDPDESPLLVRLMGAGSAVPVPDAGPALTDGGVDDGMPTLPDAPSNGGGCGCRIAARETNPFHPAGLAAAALFGVVWMRRRR